MRDITPQIQSAGAQLVVVGNGSVEQPGWFVEDYGIETPAFTDPTLSVYQIIGAKGGVLIIMPDGSIPYSFLASASGDHPKLQDILEALNRVVDSRA